MTKFLLTLLLFITSCFGNIGLHPDGLITGLEREQIEASRVLNEQGKTYEKAKIDKKFLDKAENTCRDWRYYIRK